MPKKLTLNEKKLLNDAVTGETKRCLAVVNKVCRIANMPAPISGDSATWQTLIDHIKKHLISEMINESPYIKFHPQLLKRIPK